MALVAIATAFLIATPVAAATSGQITGTATDASSEAPIEAAWVCAYEAGGGEYGGCAETDASGEYTISELPAGSYKVEFEAPYGSNYLNQYYDEKSSWWEADPVSVTSGSTTSNIDARMQEGGQIEGVAIDASSEAPIEAAWVCAYEAGSGGYGGCAETNAAGEYTIVGLAAGSYKVEFTGGGYESPYVTQYYNGKSSWEEADPVAVTAGATTSNIDAQMHEGGQIKGKVTKAAGGAALEGVEVCAKASTYEYGHCTSTNASGEYTIAALATGSYKVEFSPGYQSPNYLAQYYNGKSSWEEADTVAVTAGATTSGIDAQMQEGGEIRGKVTKASGGAAIQGIEVCTRVSKYDYYGSCAWTNASGEYTIAGLATGSYRVEFSVGDGTGNYIPQFYNGKATWEEADLVPVTAGATTSGIDAQMQEGGKIAGKVTKAAGGAPLEGIEVCAYGGGELSNSCAETEASGEYTIVGLATDSYRVVFSAPYTCTPVCTQQNYLTQYYNGKSTWEEADLAPVTAGATTAGIDAQMQEGGKIAGKVTKAAGGAAISGAWVCAYEAGESMYEYGRCASTNATGEYTIANLAAGSYKVKFSGAYGGTSYLTQYYDGKSSWEEADAVAVTAEAATENIDAQMVEGGKIKGKVTKASDSAAIAGISVCAGGIETGTYEYGRCASTNATGEYTIAGLATGSYKVKFGGGNYLTQYYDGKPSWEEADLVTVTAGITTSNIDAQMQEGGQIKGKVTKAASSAAIEGILACAYEAGGDMYESMGCASTNEGGEYTIAGLATGSYKVKFSAGYEGGNYLTQYYNGKSSWEEANPVSVTAGATTSGINAQMVAGGRIKGKVTRALNGAPIEGIEVCASTGDQELDGCVWTNGSGEYTISRLPSGSYKVKFSAGYEGGNYVTQYYNGKSSLEEADAVSVTAGSTTSNVDAQMQEGGRIKGKVTEASGGEPIEWAWICAYKPGDEEPERCTESNFSGNYTLSGLATGSYQVEFGPGYSCSPYTCTRQNYVRQFYDNKASRDEADPVSVTAGATQEGIDAALQAGGEISGRVTDAASGEPVPWSTVCAYRSGEEEPESCGESDESGDYLISGLSGGSHAVEFGPGYSCGLYTCTENNYAVEFYDNKPSLATADPVNVTVGANHEGIDAALEELSGSKPVNTALPQLTGTPAVGETLSCSKGSWENSPTSYAYAWRRDGSPISGQSGSTYVVQSADRGHSITCKVTASNEAGSASAISNALYVPAPPINTAPPELTGTPAIGQTLSCSTGTWENSPTSYAYAWMRGASPIGGEVGSTYKVVAADQGYNITCEVTASNADGEASATSDPLAVPAAAGAPVNTAPPELTGTPAVGETLSCSTGTWENSPASYAYAWRRDGSPISGQSGSTYVVQSADAGHGISCEVTATNGGGSTSAASNVLEVPAKPINTAAPSLTGTPAVGQTLTCSKGTWTNTNSSTSYAYAWRRDGSPISGQSGNTYVVQSADAGHGISCEVTATNGGGSASASSNTLQVSAPITEGSSGSTGQEGTTETTPPPSPKPKKCKKGFKKKKIKGKVKCVKLKHNRKHHH